MEEKSDDKTFWGIIIGAIGAMALHALVYFGLPWAKKKVDDFKSLGGGVSNGS